MPTDDERREVARRLREIEQGVTRAFIPTRELAESILRAIDYGRSDAVTPYGCLADLIEPPYPDATAIYKGWRAEVYDPDGVLASPSNVAADLVRAYADGKAVDDD